MQSTTSDREDEGESTLTLDRAWAALRRRARLAVIVTGLGIAVSGLVVMSLPTRYEATATVQIDPRKKTISNIDSVVADLRMDSQTGDSEIEIIKSRDVILKVIDKLDLRSDPELSGSASTTSFWRQFWAKAPSEIAPQHADKLPAPRDDDEIDQILNGEITGSINPARDEVAAAFADRLVVKRVRMTLLFEIQYSSADAAKAARIANAVAEAYLEAQLEEKRRASGMATTMLREQLESLKVKVAAAERNVEDYKTANNIFDTGGEFLTDRQLTLHMEQINNARNASAEARSRLDQVTRLIAGGAGIENVPEILGSPGVRQLQDTLAHVAQHRAELESKYGPKHPELQKVVAEYNQVRTGLNAEVQRYADKMKNDLEVAEGRERQLAQNLATLKSQQTAAKGAGVALKELEREAATEKQIFESLLARYRQTAETQSLMLPDSRIVQTAEEPLSPAAPKRKRIMIIATLGALLAGIGLALGLEFMTAGFSRPEDVEYTLDLKHLSSLPVVPHGAAAGNGNMKSARLILAEPHGLFAEAVRGARREIDLRRRDGAPRLIMVASSLPGEGSELIASNLAHHYALTGNRVLLVDADLRRWNLTRQLAPSSATGLLDVLGGRVGLDRAILRDGATGLHFLPATGPNPLQSSSPEMLGSPRMSSILASLKSQFDTIVMDVPPLLPVIDGRILADLADQIVFVTSWRRTPDQLAKRAIRGLGINQQKIAGVIVNEVDTDILEDSQSYVSPAASARGSTLRRAA